MNQMVVFPGIIRQEFLLLSEMFRRIVICVFQLFVRCLPNHQHHWQNASSVYLFIVENTRSLQTLRRQLPAFVDATIQKEMQATEYHLELQPLTSIHLQSNLDYEISPNSSLSQDLYFQCDRFTDSCLLQSLTM